MIIGAIADDFTGASDLANTLARGGMATTQFVGVPDRSPSASCEAGVVALKTRSIGAADAVQQSLATLDWLKAAGCRQFIFKYCSTFDSTPKGNIGPVAEALLEALDVPYAVVCPAFPENGRRVFMGHLFVHDRLLSESGMESHPITPMTDPDIRRWLARQTKVPVGHVPLSAVRKGDEALAATLAAEGGAGRRLVVVDAVEDSDLLTIGRASREAVLVTGGSGIALGLPENFRGQRMPARSEPAGVAGPGCVLSGSCSTMSRRQVAAYEASHPVLQVDPAALIDGTMNADRALQWLSGQTRLTPMISTTADPAVVSELQKRLGREPVASAVEAFFAAVARGAADAGIRRILVGGGETSGAVVSALAIDALEVGAEIDPGVPTLFAERGGERLGLVLKSGNFGDENFYTKALSALEAT